MFPNVNPRQMEQMMKKMGINQSEIDAKEVIIRTEEKDIVITDPSVVKINAMGQESFQVTGNVTERSRSANIEISEDDINTVAEQAKVTKAKAKKALEETKGDIAEAILKLSP